jgi:hypothetical protein
MFSKVPYVIFIFILLLSLSTFLHFFLYYFLFFSSLFLYPWPDFSSIYKICCFLNFFQLSSCPPQIVFAELHVFANTCNLFPHIRTHSVCTFSVEILSLKQMECTLKRLSQEFNFGFQKLKYHYFS